MATTVASPALQRHSLVAQWHLFSLDAPCVAIVWTLFFARSFRVVLQPRTLCALGLVVWMLYVADRIADGLRAGAHMEARHHFYAQHRTTFLIGLGIAAPILAVLVIGLPAYLRTGWLVLGVPLAAYIAAVHGLRWRIRKEMVVAVIFAIACAMPTLVSGVSGLHAAAGVAAFASLCWLNCIAIARWERRPAGALFPSLAALTLAAASCAALLSLWPLALAVALSTLTLLLLHRKGRELAAVDRRALADAALLSPLLVLVVQAVTNR